ncbi:MAG: GtrA family protein [Oscillospiraceae bacterium]|nr:GtrA family protein [Oscillospiraceae bacterium]
MIGKLKEIYQKHREILLYLFFGGLTTVVSISVHYAILFWLADNTAIATTGSWICAVTFAFFVNKVFVFRSVSTNVADWFKQAFAFYGARIATFFIELGFLLLMVDVLHFNEYVMKVIAQVFVLITNYLLGKFWVFKKKS